MHKKIREAMELALLELEQSHSTYYKKCKGGCPNEEAINALKEALDPNLIQSISVHGRRWFRRSAGNSYCSAVIKINGEVVATLEPEGGGGSYYVQRAGEWLHRNGKITLQEYNNGGLQPLWQYCNDHGIEFEDTVQDVARERDL